MRALAAAPARPRASRVALTAALAISIMPVQSTSAAARELLANPGFERVEAGRASGWSAYEAGYTLDMAAGRSGPRAIRCAAATQAELRGATARVVLDQRVATPILVTGWSRAEDVGGTPNNDYSIYLDLVYADGTPLWGQTAPFPTGTHGWVKQQVLVVPEKPVRELFVHALFRRHSGTVWFDDFHVEELAPGALFDSQVLRAPSLPPDARGVWFVRDVASGSRIVPFSESRALRLRATASTRGARRNATIVDASGRDRAVTVYYVERVEPRPTKWWQDIRTHVAVQASREYLNVTRAPNVGAVGLMSSYPFGCVTGPRAGVAIGVPPDAGPRITRIGYNAGSRLLFVACDVALTAQNRANRLGGHAQARVAVVRYPVDPAWGFRSAADRYYRLFPQAFARRATAEGIWIPFTAPHTVQGSVDFGFAYHEGDDAIAEDDRLGVLSFRYTEPMTWWMSMRPEEPRDYAYAMRLAREAAAGPDGDRKRWAQCLLNSGSQDAAGRFNVDFVEAPWSKGAVWALNPNPRLPARAGEFTKARHSYTPAMADRMYGPAAKGVQDGEYLDSLEGWADVLDFRKESLSYASTPPTFTTDSRRPVIPTWFSVYEFARYVRQDLVRRGKLLMANSTPWRIHAFAPLLDILGTETNWNPGGTWQPDSDAVFNLRRTLCYHKPYLLLQNTDFDRFGPDLVERYFQRSMFYGVYPSMFSIDAANLPYWQTPRWYNRDRHLFRRYIPVIRQLSAAGWEPITYAGASDPRMYIERYGKRHLTVLNSTSSRVAVSLSVELDQLAPRPRQGATVRFVDAVTGAVAASMPAAPRVSVPLALGPEEARSLRIEYLAPQHGAQRGGGKP